MTEEAREFRQYVRGTNHGRLKIVGLDLLPFVEGAALAGIGRASGAEWVPAVPFVADLLVNCEGLITRRGMWSSVKYGLGVVAVYADKIIPYVSQVYEKM